MQFNIFLFRTIDLRITKYLMSMQINLKNFVLIIKVKI